MYTLYTYTFKRILHTIAFAHQIITVYTQTTFQLYNIKCYITHDFYY